ncbi:WD40 repeat domain-containing protein, partial [[Kitasatospora] papulosa]|uniref:WD40 repeat domain-containing protein n=1 Tax=[Kitasatospora] papulosa TaxID=1464011 RepID=UPI0036847307
VTAVAFSPDGTLLATGSNDQTARLWDTATRTPVGPPLTSHSGRVKAVAFSPDGSILATGSRDGTVQLWVVPAHAG